MKKLLYLTLIIPFLTACGPRLSPYTQRLYEDQGWNENDLRRIQFYLSEDLVLSREARGGSSTITRGQIKIVDGREVEQVVIKRNTPGVFLFSPRENRMAVSFESSDDLFLIFGPNPRTGNRYTLRGSEWNRSGGKVTYAGQEWFVGGGDALAFLRVAIKRQRNRDVNSRVAGGRKID
ncbi:MAG: hypothetical protein AAF741_05665 [Bacteroidota bacterium]